MKRRTSCDDTATSATTAEDGDSQQAKVSRKNSVDPIENPAEMSLDLDLHGKASDIDRGGNVEAQAREAIVAPPATIGLEDDWGDINEVSLILDGLFDRTSQGSLRCALLHQLYYACTNRTHVDREVNRMRESGLLRSFASSAGTLLMSTRDYVNDLRKAANASPEHHACLEVFERWAKNCLHTSVLESDLRLGLLVELQGQGAEQSAGKKQYELKEEDISVLVKLGFLLPRRDAEVRAMWIHHPRLGLTSANILNVRKQLVAMASRTRFKEVSVKQVAKSKLRMQHGQGQWVPFAHEFFLQDVFGAGLLREHRAPDGDRWLRQDR
jgi:hypothetical protein